MLLEFKSFNDQGYFTKTKQEAMRECKMSITMYDCTHGGNITYTRYDKT